MSAQTSRKKLVVNPKSQNSILNYYENIPGWNIDEIVNAKVMVVGAGALGNEVLKNLALLNVGHILIVDFDVIEPSNLARSVLFRESDCIGGDQQKAEVASSRIKEINPKVKLMTINGDIMLDVGLGIFRRMDVVIGCLDNRLARLYINRHCHKVGKTWIDGAIGNLGGQLNVYRPDTNCYECELTDKGWKNIRERLGCPDIARRNALNGKISTTPIASSIIAAFQVQEALKVIWNNQEQSMAGKQFRYDGMNNLMLTYDSPPLQDNCESHFPYDSVIEAKELSYAHSIKDTLNWLSVHFKHPDPKIELDYEIVLEIKTEKSEKVESMVIPKPHFSDVVAQGFQDVPGEEILFSKEVDHISSEFPDQSVRLSELGIAALDIIRVRIDDEVFFVELTGDVDYLEFN